MEVIGGREFIVIFMYIWGIIGVISSYKTFYWTPVKRWFETFRLQVWHLFSGRVMPVKSILILFFSSLATTSYSQDTLSITFIGDIMQHNSQIESAYNSQLNSYEYDSCFKYLKEEMADSDLTIANLEFTFGGKPYSGYPAFSAPNQLAEALLHSGVDILVTANNHTCDRRKKGVIGTLDVLDSVGLKHTGSFRSQAEKESQYPMLIEKSGIRIALLNYTYGTNGIPVSTPTRVSLINEDSIKSDLEKAKVMKVDKIIAFMHWGTEYTHEPNSYQKRYAKLLFDYGANFVIGSHPHVLQPMYHEQSDFSKEETVLVYSLGNFISNQRTFPRDGGAMFKMTLIKNNSAVEISEVGYMLTWVWRPIVEGKKKYYVMPVARYENDLQIMDKWSHNKMMTFAREMRELLKKNKNVPEYRYNMGNWFLEE